MRYVEQRAVNGDPDSGDCLAACLASILDLDLDEVPNFSPAAMLKRYGEQLPPEVEDLQDWAVAEWLRPRGFTAESISPWCAEGGEWAFPRVDVGGLLIASAWSPRLPDMAHAVVTLDGTLLWDPHPRRHLGIGPVFAWLIIEREGRRLRP